MGPVGRRPQPTVLAQLEPDTDSRLKTMPTDKKENYIYPFSLDVVSLYTSIPQQETTEVTKSIIGDAST